MIIDNTENFFFLIDKPLHITSFDVIRELRKKFHIKRMGHAGTLDPLASGLLLVATGNYTKLLHYLSNEDKTYEYTLSLDGVSPSFDLGTEVEHISREKYEYFKKKLSKEKIEELMNDHFLGTISQIPPKYSAIKIDGKKSLERIRNGEDFEIQAKSIQIFKNEILNFEYPFVTIRSHVSSGTYIRSIAYDLGNLIGSGGYITKLRRTSLSYFDVSQASSLADISIENAIKVEYIFSPSISLNEDEISELNFGRKIQANGQDWENSKTLFVVNNLLISHVIEYNNGFYIPIRKII